MASMTTSQCGQSQWLGWSNSAPALDASYRHGDQALELRRLELVLGMIKTIEAERDAMASAKKPSMHTNAKKIQNLVKLKSIGPEFATVLVGEVFFRPLAIASRLRAMSD
jgi:hypothetical protein